jgi:hypothetical protein
MSKPQKDEVGNDLVDKLPNTFSKDLKQTIFMPSYMIYPEV